MNSKPLLTVIFLFNLLFLHVGCEQERAQQQLKEPSQTFVPTLEVIQGQWFIVATNPAFAGKVITDYISYEFGIDRSVTKTTRSREKVQIEKGTYSWNQKTSMVEVQSDLGEAGVQEWTWKQEAPGRARITYWKNLTDGYERSTDDLYVKKGSDEWNRRGKKALNPGISSTFIDPFDLEIGARYRLTKETPLMPEFEPTAPIGALQAVKKIPPRGMITILSIKQKANSPWYNVRYRTNEGWINSVALVGQSLEKMR